jgi:hypothetical protein
MDGRFTPWMLWSISEYASAGRFSAVANVLMKSTTGIEGELTAVPQQVTSSSRTTKLCRGMALALIAVFLASVARFYHRDTGFTSLIGFPAGHDDKAPQLQGVSYFEYPAWASYDGQFYAQRALDPLVRDPRVDHAMDLAPYRARRILFSWTAYALGLGRPAWILEAFALQNVASWLILAVVLTRWLPLNTFRGVALWTACLFSHGLMWSVRFALLDGPSLVLTAWMVMEAERGRYLTSAAIAGINGLARETNVLGVLAQPLAGTDRPSSLRKWVRMVVALLLVVLPILVWEDYLRSIYRSTIFAGGREQLTMPMAALVTTVAHVVDLVKSMGVFSSAGLQICIVLSMIVQAVYVAVRRPYHQPWWRIAAAYAVLMLVIDRVLWDPSTGAITRVMLPLTVGFNVLLAHEPRQGSFWAWFTAGNLHLIPTFWVMPLL